MKNHQSKLISGSFSPIQARDLLLALFNYKVDFHKNENFSSNLRFGVDQELSQNRIKALQLEKADLVKWLDSLNETDKLSINCNILIDKLA